MNEALAQQYDSLYASDGYVFGADGPLAVVRMVPELLPSARVLDIGGGEGRNALYLAEQGCAVTAVDISKVGLEKLQKNAQVAGLSVQTEVSDIRGWDWNVDYDVILMTFVLHHLASEDAMQVIKKAQQGIRAQGLHIIATFGDNGELFERNKHTNRFYPNESMLRELYQDWNVISVLSKEVTTMARDKNGNNLKNQLLTLVARQQ
jgi:2-polyprenyl-3-methyl-5-hydroxy-6-metoxy-1,4-benzoquinol methylase